ncbi:winged helix-turn-helix domain-containing protein [Vibrio chagasii]|nr:winged helix-turn-helix domain-containing protein [Vibrio chagasii]
MTATGVYVTSLLATRPGRVYSKDELLNHVWNTDHSARPVTCV